MDFSLCQSSLSWEEDGQLSWGGSSPVSREGQALRAHPQGSQPPRDSTRSSSTCHEGALAPGLAAPNKRIQEVFPLK